jgi:hypothetical protein
VVGQVQNVGEERAGGSGGVVRITPSKLSRPFKPKCKPPSRAAVQVARKIISPRRA